MAIRSLRRLRKHTLRGANKRPAPRGRRPKSPQDTSENYINTDINDPTFDHDMGSWDFMSEPIPGDAEATDQPDQPTENNDDGDAAYSDNGLCKPNEEANTIHWLLNTAQAARKLADDEYTMNDDIDDDVDHYTETEEDKMDNINATSEHPLGAQEAGNSEVQEVNSSDPTIQVNDPAELLVHKQDKDCMDPFTTAFALWTESAGISRELYQSLLQILRTLKDITPIHNLPNGLSNLKKKCRAQFPILPLRRTQIPIISPDQMPTFSHAEKRLTDHTLMSLYFQDMVSLVSRLVRSQRFQQHMHIGMAEVVDSPTELWHSHSWGSSIKHCSGEFALYPSTSEPIFPSDFIRYQCENDKCPCRRPDKTNFNHMGRVRFIGKDRRETSPYFNRTVLQIQSTMRYSTLNAEGPNFQSPHPPFHRREVILVESNILNTILASSVLSRAYIFIDYTFNGTNNTFPTENSTPGLFLRRVLHVASATTRPYCRSTPIRGELEIAVHGREFLKNTFAGGQKVLSLPYQLFIDGFGLYRNMYRSLMGVYWIPALSAAERKKRNNLFTVTFGPHGTNFPDTVGALSPGFLQLDGEGILVNIDGDTVRVVSSCLSFIGDMPQQNGNAGIKGPSAEYSCRSCLVGDRKRSDLSFDIVQNGRYHHDTQQVRRQAESAPNLTKRKELRQRSGLADNDSCLFKICPSLNLVTFFPSDPAHSEYSGISKMAHSVLVESALTPVGKTEYLRILQTFPFPRGWARLQSPLTHLEKYQLQEHARASVLIPLILRCGLKRSWLKDQIHRALPLAFSKLGTPAVNLTIDVFTAIARSNSILLSHNPAVHDPKEIRQIITTARQYLQFFLDAAANTVQRARAPSHAGSVSQSRRASPAPSQVLVSTRPDGYSTFATAEGPEQDPALSTKKGASFIGMKNRPNMHIGLHYVDEIREYGTANNSNVLMGEDKHRDYKQLVRRTNHRDVEKVLLQQESFRRTVQLAFHGAFDDSQPELGERLRKIHEHCPALLTNLIRVDDRESDDVLSTDESCVLENLPDHTWKSLQVNLISLLSPKNGMDMLGIPTNRISNLPNVHPFLQKLRQAYSLDWNKPSILEPGPRPLRFYRKITFIPKYHLSFSLGRC